MRRRGEFFTSCSLSLKENSDTSFHFRSCVCSMFSDSLNDILLAIEEMFDSLLVTTSLIGLGSGVIDTELSANVLAELTTSTRDIASSLVGVSGGVRDPVISCTTVGLDRNSSSCIGSGD